MAKNRRLNDALHITLPVPAGVKSGEPVAVGAFRGQAITDRDAAGEATVWLDGSAEYTVTGAVGTVGLPIYITSARALNTTATDNQLFGYALGTKAAAAGPLEVVHLNGPAQV